MTEIKIAVADKIATVKGSPSIVCGNSDYVVTFELDAEWDDQTVKTARFNYTRDGVRRHQDVLLDGSSCAVPVMHEVYAVEIGIYAGDIHTSTPARVPCIRSATDDAAEHPIPEPDVYDQLLELLQNAQFSEPFAVSDVFPISNGGAAADIFAIAEEVN